MNCLICKGGQMIESFEPYFVKLQNGYLIIENVPCWKCEQCGEVLFSMSVLEKIEELIADCEKLSRKISLIDYQKTAA
jgi:YgiT-type zinc finger domain-containing protein